jgi:transposase
MYHVLYSLHPQPFIWFYCISNSNDFVVYISEKLREGQLRGTLNNIKKALNTLNQLQVKLIVPKKRGKKRTIENLNKQIKQIIKKYKLLNVIKYELTENGNNVFSLKSWVDEKEVYRLYNEEFGRRILITNRHNLQTEKIILSYWCQSHIERVFRDTKNPFHLAVRPQYHWTDQKIIVHNFILIIALLLVSVLYKRAHEKMNYKGSFHSLLEKLNNIRLTTLIRKPKEKSKGRFQIKYQLEELDKDQIKLTEAFGIDKLQYKAESAFSVYE